MTLAGKAYGDEQFAVFQNDNWLHNSLKAMLGAAKNGGGAAGKGFESAVNFEFPILKTGTNIAFDLGSYAAGGLKATGTIIKNQLAGGIKEMTPEQADYILKNLKKQTVGAALFAIGYMGAKGIGGYYQEGDNKKGGQKAGTIGQAPAWSVHSPALDLLQMGATVKRVKDAKGSTGAGFYAAAQGGVLETPLFDGIAQITRDLKNSESAEKMVGKTVTSMVVPPLVSQVAKWTDKSETRKTRSGLDEFKKAVPGLRETLPTQ